MMIWLQNNLSTLIVGVVLLAIVAFVCLSMVRNKRKGKSSCGCGCKDCALSDKCHGAGNHGG